MQIAVIGGSIGGLSAAIALLRNIKPEPRVTVFERSSHPLEDRGAGLAISLELYRQVTGDVDLEQLVYERGKYSRSEMLSLAGQVQGVDFVTPSDQPKNQWRGTVSYDNIMTALLAVYGTLGGEYVRGKRVLRVDLRDSQADIVFEDGATFRANLVVGCDGYMSDVRAQLLALYPPPVEAPVGSEDFRTLPPSSRPRYDGLLIFRGVLEQNLIPDGIYESILRPGCGNYNVFYDRAEKLYWGCE
jgi:salicylate hydroxylase